MSGSLGRKITARHQTPGTRSDDPSRQDAFRDALRARTGDADPGGQRHARFQLDAAARCRDLAEWAGLTDISGNLIRWTAELDTAQLRALCVSMIRIRRLPAGDQRRIPDQISLLADHDFAGRVQRPFITAMYAGRRHRPDRNAQVLKRRARWFAADARVRA